MANRWGKKWKQRQTFFSLTLKSLQMVTAAMKLKDACSLEENLWQPRQCIAKQRHHFANKGLYSQSYGFSNSHVCMWVLDHKEGPIWYFQIVVLEKTLWVSWTAKSPRSNQSILKEINPEYSLEGLLLKLKLQYIGHLMHAKSWLIRKDPDAGKD